MHNQPIRYFARVTAGTEAISWTEIKTLLDAQRIHQGPRTLEFTCSQPPARLLLLRSVDDVYLYLGTIFGLDKTNPSLSALAQAQTWNLLEAVEICRQVRHIPSIPSYAITGSLETPCNYSRFEAADALRQALGAVPWRYIDHRDNNQVADLDIRLIINGNHATAGLRLGIQPLHRRTYKQASIPGSLKAPVAFCMLLLANPRPNEIILDPMCGVSTILFEAESNWAPRLIIGADLQESAISKARLNAAEARSQAQFLLADTHCMPFRERSIDRICSNLPWGHQVPLEDMDYFHAHLLTEVRRVLRPTGRAVLLTSQTGSVMQALKNAPDLHLVLSQQISLYGKHPTMLVFIKQARRPDYLHPFIQFRDEEECLTEVVQNALLCSLNHPDVALRLRAARAIYRSKNADLRQALAERIQDSCPEIRELASRVQH